MAAHSPLRPVRWQLDDGVGQIILDRADAANALDAGCAEGLIAAIEQAGRPEVRAVVISARGRQFCAGGDINEFLRRRDELDGAIDDALDRMLPPLLALAALPVPVISAVQGSVGGAGIALALCADIVLASSAMKLRGGYSAIGLSPDLGASYFLARRAGAARAKLVLMTNRALDAQQCLQWGLVDELHASDDVLPAALALARQLAQGAAQSLAGIKVLCDTAHGHDLATHVQLERDALLRCAASGDAREGVAAFIEKRAPRFAARRGA